MIDRNTPTMLSRAIDETRGHDLIARHRRAGHAGIAVGPEERYAQPRRTDSNVNAHRHVASAYEVK